jgi:hypothetical protein
MQKDVSRFLNSEGQISVWPKKHADKQLILLYLIDKFSVERVYSEKEVNEVLNKWHTFQDWPLLRRALIDSGLMRRDIEGREYRLN